jgi:hypothetical protein
VHLLPYYLLLANSNKYFSPAVFHSQAHFGQQTRSTMDCTVACSNASSLPQSAYFVLVEMWFGEGGRMREVGRAFRGLALDELAAVKVFGFAGQQVFIDC